MNNIKYGGIYWVNNLMDKGGIYLRFFRNGTLAYLINSNTAIDEKTFNLLQRNYSKNIDVEKYYKNNDDINFIMKTQKCIFQLSGKVNNDCLILNITNSTRNDVINNIVFSFYKKQYSNINDNIIKNQTQIRNKASKIKKEERIPGGPQIARSYNGFSYRTISKWKP